MEMHKKHPQKWELINQDQELLRQPSVEVNTSAADAVNNIGAIVKDLEAALFIDNRIEILRDNVIGFGLAACQLRKYVDDQQQAPRISIIRIPKLADAHKQLVLNLVNPQILEARSPYQYKGEGCLSYPGQYLSTRRFRIVKVGWIDAATLKPRESVFFEFEAVVMQHEIDHHDGILFMDRAMKPVVAKKKLRPNERCSCGSGKKFKKCCME